MTHPPVHDATAAAPWQMVFDAPSMEAARKIEASSPHGMHE